MQNEHPKLLNQQRLRALECACCSCVCVFWYSSRICECEHTKQIFNVSIFRQCKPNPPMNPMKKNFISTIFKMEQNESSERFIFEKEKIIAKEGERGIET